MELDFSDKCSLLCLQFVQFGVVLVNVLFLFNLLHFLLFLELSLFFACGLVVNSFFLVKSSTLFSNSGFNCCIVDLQFLHISVDLVHRFSEFNISIFLFLVPMLYFFINSGLFLFCFFDCLLVVGGPNNINSEDSR